MHQKVGLPLILVSVLFTTQVNSAPLSDSSVLVSFDTPFVSFQNTEALHLNEHTTVSLYNPLLNAQSSALRGEQQYSAQSLLAGHFISGVYSSTAGSKVEQEYLNESDQDVALHYALDIAGGEILATSFDENLASLSAQASFEFLSGSDSLYFTQAEVKLDQNISWFDLEGSGFQGRLEREAGGIAYRWDPQSLVFDLGVIEANDYNKVAAVSSLSLLGAVSEDLSQLASQGMSYASAQLTSSGRFFIPTLSGTQSVSEPPVILLLAALFGLLARRRLRSAE